MVPILYIIFIIIIALSQLSGVIFMRSTIENYVILYSDLLSCSKMRGVCVCTCNVCLCALFAGAHIHEHVCACTWKQEPILGSWGLYVKRLHNEVL